MRKTILMLFTLLITGLFATSDALADGAVVITEPANNSTVSSPVKVCMEVEGVEVEPAKNGVNDGKGHHHLIVNADLPADLTQPIGKDLRHIHMGDGSTCKELKMAPGKHIIRALFASGNHVPHNPVITSNVFITVE